jgi:hypothetical protein
VREKALCGNTDRTPSSLTPQATLLPEDEDEIEMPLFDDDEEDEGQLRNMPAIRIPPRGAGGLRGLRGGEDVAAEQKDDGGGPMTVREALRAGGDAPEAAAAEGGSGHANVMSERTRSVKAFLQRTLPAGVTAEVTMAAAARGGGGGGSSQRMLRGCTRREAACLFFEMLLLNNKGYVTLQQDEPFADVLLHRTAALSL